MRASRDTARRTVALAAVLLFAACGTTTPTDPRVPGASLAADLTITVAKADDYSYSVRIRLHDLGGPGVTITSAGLTLSSPNGSIVKALDGLVSKTFRETEDGLAFANDPGLALAGTATLLIRYVDQAGHAGSFSKTDAIPACWDSYGVFCAPSQLEVGGTANCGGGIEWGCKPMHLPLPASSIPWQSKSPQVATVSSAGVLTAHSGGVAVIVGSFGPSLSSSFPVCVAGGCTPDAVAISPHVESFAVGAKQIFEIAVSWGGQGPTFTNAAQWQSSNPLVGAFQTKGLPNVFSAFAPGTTTVTATYLGVSGSLVVTVK